MGRGVNFGVRGGWPLTGGHRIDRGGGRTVLNKGRDTAVNEEPFSIRDSRGCRVERTDRGLTQFASGLRVAGTGCTSGLTHTQDVSQEHAP